jgi:DNA-binding response OmpR family regulator
LAGVNVKYGEEGIILAETEQYDAIAFDLTSPEVPGVGALNRPRDQGRSANGLILTALDGPQKHVAGLNFGATTLTHPFTFEELVGAGPNGSSIRRSTSPPGASSAAAGRSNFQRSSTFFFRFRRRTKGRL